MEKGYKFSEAAIQSRRRKLRAKRLWKKSPIFAYETLSKEIEGYSLLDFDKDIKSKTKPKTNKKKTTLERYGRYWEYRRVLALYNDTKNSDYYFAAKRLRDNMTKPYRFQVTFKGEKKEYSFEATTKYQTVVELQKLVKTCESIQEFDQKLEAYISSLNRYSGQ
ncbi:hypothetical protein [Emticicia sp. BO119]|uniref:hypothetical protein n=1 Tax=Emticicia sp. BO119 TaxID=2757768 RepID=UPI0015F11D78|nr:hypothetical protein [Emticicia sp. BO119]MBA4852046.1 hypothetical protein [Emticicia sp. BO119]